MHPQMRVLIFLILSFNFVDFHKPSIFLSKVHRMDETIQHT